MKNKLSEKVETQKFLYTKPFTEYTSLDRVKINEIIDYLAELTEVVQELKSKQKNKHYTEEDIELTVEQTMQEISDVVYSKPILLAKLKKKEIRD